MKNFRILLYFLFITIALPSCVKDANVKLPKVETKLVLSSFISPQDELINVSVSMSVPIYNNPDAYKNYAPVTNATVVISSGSDSWTLPYDAQYKRYVLDSSHIKIRAGASYNLSVSTPEGKFAEAFTTVPYLNNTAKFDAVASGTNGYKVNAQWQDPAASKDYYQFEIRYANSKPSDPYFPFKNLKDEENPGGLLKRSIELSQYITPNDTVFASLSVTSPEFYQYYDRLGKLSGADGLFSEPLPMYTNIKGGFGIFSAFNKYEVRIFP